MGGPNSSVNGILDRPEAANEGVALWSKPTFAVACETNSMESPSPPRRIGVNHFRAKVIVVNEMGLHARPATLFVELANRFRCNVTVQKASSRVDGKSILQLLTLGADMGTCLLLETKGDDAQEAIAALYGLVTTGFENDAPPGKP